MSKTKLNLMIRVFKARMNEGETFDEILLDYPKMTIEDIEQLKTALGVE